jgi:hypothetical protein
MTDPDISMAEVMHQFVPTVPQVVFDFVGSNRIGLTVQQKRAVLTMMATVYHQGVGVGRRTVGADEAERMLYHELDSLAQRIAKLEKHA